MLKRELAFILITEMLFIFILGALISPRALAVVEIDVEASVYRVVDGDTFDAFPVGRVRLADINAPELDEPGGVEAKNALISLILNMRVYLDVDDVYVMDKYNRLVCVAYVRYNSTHILNVNKWLLENNYAVVSDYVNEFDPASWSLFMYYPELKEIIGPITLPEPPPLPEPKYVWITTNETFLYVSYEGVNCSAGLVFGLYLPQDIELNKNYTVYIYITRVFEQSIITLPIATLPVELCIGVGIKPLLGKYLHFGIGLLCVWDKWMLHIPLHFPCSLTLSVSYPNITYSSILDVPLGRWEGPYKVQFTMIEGYTQVKAVPIEFEGTTYNLSIFSNSEISELKFIQESKLITFNALGVEGTEGFCNITIPKVLLAGPWKVYVDGEEKPFIEVENSTHSSIYFTYKHSTRNIQIIGTYVIPEYTSTAITLIIASLSPIIVFCYKKVAKTRSSCVI